MNDRLAAFLRDVENLPPGEQFEIVSIRFGRDGVDHEFTAADVCAIVQQFLNLEARVTQLEQEVSS